MRSAVTSVDSPKGSGPIWLSTATACSWNRGCVVDRGSPAGEGGPWEASWPACASAWRLYRTPCGGHLRREDTNNASQLLDPARKRQLLPRYNILTRALAP